MEELRRVVIAFAGAIAGFGAALIILSFWHPAYHSYDGIVGPPAVLGYSPEKKVWGYILAVGLSIVGAFAFPAVERLHGKRREPQASPIGLATGLGFSLISFGVILVAIQWLPTEYRTTFSQFREDQALWLETAIAAAAIVSVCLRTSARRPFADTRETLGFGGLDYFSTYAILSLQIWIILTAFAGEPYLPLATALILPGATTAIMALDRSARRRRANSILGVEWPRASVSNRSAEIPYRLLALFSLVCVYDRFAMNVDWPIAASKNLPPGLLVVLSAGLFSWLIIRTLSFGRSSIRPLILIPFLAAVLYNGAGIPLVEYDPYHSGEYIYAAKAMKEGLLPFRDIFYVHGFGFNTVAGWVMEKYLHQAPTLDLFFFDLILMVGLIVMGFFYLRLWGPRWWLMALALTALTAGAVATKGSRFVPLYLVLFMISEFLRGGKAAWLVAAGAVSAAGVLYSLDTGVVAVMSGVVWSLGWGLARWKRNASDARGARGARGANGASAWKPFISFCAGGAVVGIAIAAWLGALGVFRDFIEIHLAYARMKTDYDNLPLPKQGLLYLLSPAMTVAGVLTLIGAFKRSRRSDSDGKLLKQLEANEEAKADPAMNRGANEEMNTNEAGGIEDRSKGGIERGSDESLLPMIAFLVIANFLLFLRGLDRSDEGHLIYASAMAWPLLGCLIVWRARRGSYGDGLLRSAIMTALLVLIPYASPAIRGAADPVVPAVKMVEWYAENSSLPAALPAAEMDQTFFDFCRSLDRATAPGDYLLDMTDRPALYYWCHLRCPTRFYATFYMSPLSWQKEIIGRMEATQTPWVLWPAPGSPAEKIDGIDIRLRHAALAEYIQAQYEPTTATLSDGSLLLRRKLNR